MAVSGMRSPASAAPRGFRPALPHLRLHPRARPGRRSERRDALESEPGFDAAVSGRRQKGEVSAKLWSVSRGLVQGTTRREALRRRRGRLPAPRPRTASKRRAVQSATTSLPEAEHAARRAAAPTGSLSEFRRYFFGPSASGPDRHSFFTFQKLSATGPDDLSTLEPRPARRDEAPVSEGPPAKVSALPIPQDPERGRGEPQHQIARPKGDSAGTVPNFVSIAAAIMRRIFRPSSGPGPCYQDTRSRALPARRFSPSIR